MSLQFLSTQSDSLSLTNTTSLGGGGGGGASKGKGKKKAKTGNAREEQVKELLQVVTSRENSLFIFHALGKVLYNKRQ
jgi:cell cycle checkpoint protein